FADNPTQNWLWFLPVLFLFQVLYLVLSRTNVLSIKISLKTGVVLTFVIGLIYSMVISSYDLRGWFHSSILHFQRERLLLYFMVFLLGSLCYKLRIFESNNKKKKYYILSNVVLALSLSVFTAVALNLFFNIVNPERNYFFVSETIDRILYYSSLLLSMLCFLQILIHTFRFYFNKTSKLLNQLSKNSYYVYIIHVIFIGVIALILINISIPAIVKYLILAIFTYIFSNFIVYGYRGIFHRIISMKSVIATILVIILVTFAFYGKKKNIATGNQQPTTSDTTTILSGKGLHEAALQGDIEVIRQHIKVGSDLNEKEPSAGSSPLITAATFGQTEVALALIEAGADVNFKNNEGSTSLHAAAFFCHTEIVKALLANGADKNIKNNAGSTALESVAGPF
ncbi:MAG: ankyrin repeat domain-containing protein, partial [Bacteroidales bacterium]|nr:ankyrin repeat domain-containing protein [Bacteroidales bacterium]